tara:strand:- start:284 stop:427 length:144 start_codon:yes stop_codon:yes gene_type:complete
MSPQDFWNSSPIEIYMSIDGFSEFNSSGTEKPMKKKELDDLMELYPD